MLLGVDSTYSYYSHLVSVTIHLDSVRVLETEHGDVVAMRIELVHFREPAVGVRRHVDIVLNKQRYLSVVAMETWLPRVEPLAVDAGVSWLHVHRARADSPPEVSGDAPCRLVETIVFGAVDPDVEGDGPVVINDQLVHVT